MTRLITKQMRDSFNHLNLMFICKNGKFNHVNTEKKRILILKGTIK